ncbi:MAG: ABC-type dipeptide/oligopeptide/nickel transport system, permease component [Ilumatobacteraceae bacterium]|nr:ABC-type dipeptide/oligopeptide/nickel transport system, permease component [Ilumatobacteraceae bacterium]
MTAQDDSLRIDDLGDEAAPLADDRIEEIIEELPEADEGDLQLVVGADPVARSQFQLISRRFLRHRMAVIGLILLIVIMVMCFGASWIAPYPPHKQDLLAPVIGPSRHHLFGVDQLGRDYFSEILYAGQISLKIGLAVGILSTVVGFAAGSIAGYFGGTVDNLLMRLTDLFLVIPAIAVLAVALKGFGFKDVTIILVLAGLAWMSVARVVRSQVLSIREKEFVEAARAAGGSSRRIILKHILPNMIGPLMVNATLGIAGAIIAEATLSFLGFGVQPPKSSWGKMLSDAEGVIGGKQSYLLYFPGLMLLLVVLCVNFLGDGLRDAFDPQAKH